MGTYVEYELENGATILVEIEAPQGGVVPTSRDRNGNLVHKAERRLGEALQAIRPVVSALYHGLVDLPIEETEVTMGIKVVGEAGNLAIGKVGGEVNYSVTLKWKNVQDHY